MGNLAYKICFLVLLSIFLFDCVKHLQKHLSHQVTIAKSVEHRPNLVLPAVSICPGLKRDLLLQLGWPTIYAIPNPDWEEYDKTFPKSKDEAVEIFNNLTFDVNDILLKVHRKKDIGMQVDNDTETVFDLAYFKYDVQALMSADNKECLSIEQHHTVTGKCFTLTSTCQFTAASSVVLSLDFSKLDGLETLDLILHHPEATLGLNANFWPSTAVDFQEVDANVGSRDFVLATMERVVDKDSLLDEGEYYKCVRNMVRGVINESIEAGTLCHSPFFDHLLDGRTDVPSCKDSRAFYNATMAILPILFKVVVFAVIAQHLLFQAFLYFRVLTPRLKHVQSPKCSPLTKSLEGVTRICFRSCLATWSMSTLAPWTWSKRQSTSSWTHWHYLQLWVAPWGFCWALHS